MSALRSHTRSSRAVLKAMAQLSHASAQEILQWFQDQPEGQKVSLTSIYRALHILTERGEVKPLYFHDGPVRYETHQQGHAHHHHHHFVCIHCKRIDVLEYCPVALEMPKLPNNYQADYHAFDIYGRCANCATQNTP